MPNPGFPDRDLAHGAKGKLSFKLWDTPENTAPVDFPIESISVDIAVESDDVTHSGTDGWRAVLDGLAEITGSISWVWDSMNIPFVAPNPLKPRTYAMLYVYPDGVTPIQFPALMTGLSFSTGPKAGTVRCTANYRSAGTAVYPTENQATHTPPLGG